MSCSSSSPEPPVIPLIDYLDDKLGKWWEKPEITNALLTDRMYHLTHLELARVGTLTVTNKTATTAFVKYKTGSTSVFEFYQEKFDIELKYPEMPLFTCDDGELTMYPAEVIMMEIVRSTPPETTALFAGVSCKTMRLVDFLEEKIGSDWVKEPDLVKYHLKDIDFHLTEQEPSSFGSLTLSQKLPTMMMQFDTGVMSYKTWFHKEHKYDIIDVSTSLITVNQCDSQNNFHWPAELIIIVLY